MSKRVLVTHGEYGCDTGCVGHWVEVPGVGNRFDFMGPKTGEPHLDYAKRIVTEMFGAEHVADLDWENCVVRDD